MSENGEDQKQGIDAELNEVPVTPAVLPVLFSAHVSLPLSLYRPGGQGCHSVPSLPFSLSPLGTGVLCVGLRATSYPPSGNHNLPSTLLSPPAPPLPLHNSCPRHTWLSGRSRGMKKGGQEVQGQRREREGGGRGWVGTERGGS